MFACALLHSPTFQEGKPFTLISCSIELLLQNKTKGHQMPSRTFFLCFAPVRWRRGLEQKVGANCRTAPGPTYVMIYYSVLLVVWGPRGNACKTFNYESSRKQCARGQTEHSQRSPGRASFREGRSSLSAFLSPEEEEEAESAQRERERDRERKGGREGGREGGLTRSAGARLRHDSLSAGKRGPVEILRQAGMAKYWPCSGRHAAHSHDGHGCSCFHKSSTWTRRITETVDKTTYGGLQGKSIKTSEAESTRTPERQHDLHSCSRQRRIPNFT